MSWDHGTYGWERFEDFVNALRVLEIPYTQEEREEHLSRGADILCMCFCGYNPKKPDESCPCCDGTCGHKQRLRTAFFTTSSGKQMAVEEYLAVKDYDCDGADAIAIVIYEEGQRPELVTQVREAR